MNIVNKFNTERCSGKDKIMLYRTLKRMIERGQTTGLADKLDVFYAMGRITEAEYKELTELLAEKTGDKSEG